MDFDVFCLKKILQYSLFGTKWDSNSFLFDRLNATINSNYLDKKVQEAAFPSNANHLVSELKHHTGFLKAKYHDLGQRVSLSNFWTEIH